LTRRRIIIVLLLVAGFALAIQLAVSNLDVAAQRALVESRLTDAFGLEVKIAGDFEITAFPRPSLRITELRVANQPGAPSPYLLEVAELAFGFELLPLFRGAVELDDVFMSGVTAHIEPDAKAGLDIGDELHELAELPEAESDPLFRIELESVEVADLELFYRSPDTGEVHSAIVERIALESDNPGEPLSIHARGTLEGGSFDLSGRLGPLAQLLDPKEPYPFRIAGRVFESRVQIDGTVAEPTALRGLDVSIDAALPEIANLAAHWSDTLPDLGPASLHARVHDEEGTLGVDAIRFAAEGGPIRGALTGAVADVREFRGVDLELALDVDDLSRLGTIGKYRAPRDSQGRVRAALSDRERPLSLDAEARVRAADGSFLAEAKGRHVDLASVEGIEFALHVAARDLPVLGSLLRLDVALPNVGPVEAKGMLHARTGSLGLDAIAVDIGDPKGVHGTIHGSIDRLMELRGVRIKSSVRAPDASHLADLLQHDVPELGPLDSQMHLSDADGTLGVESLEIHIGKGEVSLDLSGSFEDLRDLDDAVIEAELHAKDLRAIGKLFDVELPPIGPVEFVGDLRGSDEELRSSGRIRLDRTHLQGGWLARLANGRPYFEGSFRSRHVYLDDLGIDPEHDTSEIRAEAANRVRESDPLGQLRAVDGKLDLKLDRVTGRADLDVRDVELHAVLRDGELRVQLTESVEDTLVGLHLDARTPEPLVEVHASASGIDLAKISAQLEEDTESAGSLEGRLELRSRGSTREALWDALEGRVWVRVHEWAIASRYAREFIRSLALALHDTKAPAALGCFVSSVEIKQGVAEFSQLVLDSGDVFVSGSGSIDLVRDEIDIRMIPTVRDPALLTISPTVDVSGPLSDPTFTPVKRTLATSAARAVIGRALKPAAALLRPLTGREQEAPVACEEPPPSVTRRSIQYLQGLTGDTIQRFRRSDAQSR
jgi:uncharacterized protein involved in outer membrane biogenesis